MALLVGGGIVYEIVAANVSSPQTTELNASARAPTLMKWVHLGQVQAGLFVAAAALMDRPHRRAILAGGVLANLLMAGIFLLASKTGPDEGRPPPRHAP